MLREDILKKSEQIAQDVLNVSVNLRGAGAEVDYFHRDEYFHDLVGEDGYMTFTPEVSVDVLQPFKTLLEEGEGDLISKYTTSFSDIDHFKAELARVLKNHLTSDHLLNNQVPDSVLSYIERYVLMDDEDKREARKYRSPKLSKLLVRLWGEQSEIVKWFTNKCPRDITKGKREDMTITLSVLPHHIAGMSYYSTYNHGGERWRTGYAGTSCTDPKRNGRGSGVFHLIPSLKDSNMAVAYLSIKDDRDVWNPVYQARCLVRVVHIHGETVLIGCRVYATSKETSHILVDGLKNEFGNIHFMEEIRVFEGDVTARREFIQHFPESILYSVSEVIRCDECDGDGTHGYDDYDDPIYCDTCGGDGSWEVDNTFLPYIDDSDYIYIEEDYIAFNLPVNYFESIGIDLLGKEEEIAI